jgi:hypothetical protein
MMGVGYYGKKAMSQDKFEDNVSQSPPSEDWGLSRAQYWKLKLCWFPMKCFLTNKSLWGKLAYHGERWITGPGEPVVEHYWIEKNEFLMWNLRGRK